MTTYPQAFPAPELSIHSWLNSDRPLTLAGFHGRVVVMIAFQVLCPVSVSHGIPQALRIFDTFDPGDVAVLGLHATFEHHDAHRPDVVKAFIKEYRLPFPVGVDMPNAHGPIPLSMERFKMRGTPSLVVIDRLGTIRKHAFGPVDDLRIGAEIGALAQESQASTALTRSNVA